MTSVVCLGIAVQDMVFAVDALPSGGGKLIAADLAEVGGGCAANAAATVAKLGGRAVLLTRLGDDRTGDAIVADLAALGVDMAGTLRAPGRHSPLSAVLVDRTGERLVVNHADPDMPEATDWLRPERLDGAHAVLVDQRWPDGAATLLQAARGRGIPTVLDADRAGVDPRLVTLASHVVFSADGLRAHAGAEDLGEALVETAETTPAFLAVTDGPQGVLWLEQGAVRHLPAFAVQAVDTLGAGDVFHGAFALALGEGQAVPAALRFASATAALKCTRFGGRAGIPDRAAVDAFLEEHKA